MNKFGYIYLTTNTVNNKKYIGKKESTTFVSDYFGSGVNITRAIKKYGKDQFTVKVLHWCYSLEELNTKEKEYIKIANAIESKEYYNIAPGGDGGDIVSNLPQERYDEYIKKLSSATKGKNNPMYGRKRSEEGNTTKGYEIWKNRKHPTQGVPLSDEHKQKISEANSGVNNGRYGAQWDEEHKEIFRQQKIGAKNPMYGKFGSENHTSKPVICINNGVEYESVRDASIKCNAKHVGDVCRGVRKTSGKDPVTGEKLRWRFK